MLRPRRSGLKSPPGLADEGVPCVRCDRRELYLAWGDFCSVCQAEREARANRIGRRIAILGAALMGVGLYARGLANFSTRLFGAASIVLVYLILRRLASRVVLDFFDKPLEPKA